MIARIKALIVLIFAGFPALLVAQTGNYFLSHYAPNEERFDYVCFDMAQDKKGVMFYATKSGILEFNGRDWDLLQSPSAIYSIQFASSGEMYWAGAKGYGKVSLNKHGFQQIELLSDSTVSDVFQTVVLNDHAFFLTEENIFEFDTKTGKTTRFALPEKGATFLKLFELFGVMYVNTDVGTFKAEQGKLVPSQLKLNGELIFSSRIDDVYVLGMSDNKLYSCSENLQLKSIPLQDQAYIDAGVIVSGSWLNRQLLALGTLRGGVVFVNPLNGITQEIINYSTGLPDNEVFELMTDVNQNVWVGHDYGFTKISPYMPLRAFSHYQGLSGNLLCAYSFQNTVYVGTSLGLFKLEKVDVYDNLVYYEDVLIKEPGKSAPKKQIPQKNQPAEEPKAETKPADTKKGGLFSFLKRNKGKDKGSESKPQENSNAGVAAREEESETPSAPRYKRVKRTQKILRASQFVFKRVQGIDAKITHLVEVEGKLIASGLGGLFEINDLSSRAILEEPIRYVYAPEGRDFLIVSTYEDEVRTMRLAGKVVENSSLFSDLDDQIHYAFEGDNNTLWLCGLNRIYRIDMTNNDVRHKQSVDLVQSNADKTVGVMYHGEVILSNADGFYRLDRKTSSIVHIDTLPKPSQYFAHNNSLVYRDQHGWNFLGNKKSENSLQLLNVFPALRFITSDKNPQNLWLIDGNNELYKFFGDKVTPVETEFPLFLKSIVNQGKIILKQNEISMDQEHSSVTFDVVQPDYINPRAVEFRYLLTGMNKGWSDWSSNNNEITFPYLPNGDYTLQVQARNIFGKVSELEPVSFEVLPPYWRRSWFYALEFSVFASLVMLSFRLSQRYRIVSRLLSLLTIILLIEFIQTVIGDAVLTGSSPVVDFFIQVVVALLILPVEEFLRNLMMKSLNSSGKFYQIMATKSSPLEKEEKFFKETSDIEK